MSQFLRQLNIISSLKTGSDSDKIFPFCKNLAPVAVFHPFLRPMHTQIVNKNLQLKTEEITPIDSGVPQKKGKRNLAIILSWLLAKDSHLDKYSKLYVTRGFDVLTVKVTPQQMLFPTTGSQVVATNILDYLECNKHYENVLVHAFSIGGYIMGEVFVKFHESSGKYRDFTDRISGIILDSAVDFEGIESGFPRAITKNPVAVKALEWCIKSHMNVMYNVATKHYKNSSNSFHNTPLRCPALFIVSEKDKVGTPASNMRLANDWKDKGVDVSFKCFENSVHVSHMPVYKEKYVTEIDNFLSKLNLIRY